MFSSIAALIKYGQGEKTRVAVFSSSELSKDGQYSSIKGLVCGGGGDFRAEGAVRLTRPNDEQ